MSGRNIARDDDTVTTVPKRPASPKIDPEAMREKSLALAQNTHLLEVLLQRTVTAAQAKDPDTIAKSAEAFKRNSAAQKRLKTDRKTHEADHEQAKRNAEWKPQYESRLMRIDMVIEELKQTLPVSAGHIAKLTEMRKAAVGLAVKAPPNYKAATETLDIEKITEYELSGREDYDAAMAKAETKPDLQPAIALRDKVLQQLKAAPLVYAERDRLHKLITDATAGLLVDKAKKPEATAVITALNAIAGQLATAAADAQKKRRDYEALRNRLGEVDVVIAAGPFLLPGFGPADAALLEQRELDAGNAYELHEFEIAKNILQDLLNQVATQTAAIDTARTAIVTALKKLAPRVTTAVNDMKVIAQSVALPGDMPRTAQSLAITLQEYQQLIADPETSKLNGAPTRLAQALDEATALQLRVQALPRDFTQQKAKEATQVETRLQKVEALLANVVTFVQSYAAIRQERRDGVTVPLQQNFDQIKSDWAARKTKAFDSKSLGAGVTISELSVLQTRLEALDGNDTAMKKLIETIGIEKVREKLQAALSRAAALQDAALGADPAGAMQLCANVAKAETMAKSGQDDSAMMVMTSLLEGSAKLFEGKISSVKKDVLAKQAELQQTCEQVETDLDTLATSVAKTDPSKDRRQMYEAMIDSLKASCTTLKLLVTSNQVNVLNSAIVDAKALVADVKITTTGWSTKKGSAKGEDKAWSLDQIKGYYQFCATKLSDAKTAKVFMVVSYAQLQQRLDAALSGIGKVEYMPALREMLDIEKAIVLMEDTAKKRKKTYEANLVPLCETIAGSLKAAKSGWAGSAPDFLADTEKKLAIILSNGKFEGGYQDAFAEAGKLQADMERIRTSQKNIAGEPVLLVVAQEAALQAKEQAEIEKKKYSGELEVTKEALDAAAKRGVNQAEIAKLESHVKETAKSASADYAMAREQLRMTRSRIAALEDNPDGLKIASRNKLPTLRNSFVKAVLEFGVALQALSSEIAATSLDVAGQKAVAEEMAHLRCLFSPAAFNEAIHTITEPDAEEKKRSLAREAGLREARRMSATIDTDYRLRELGNSPFKTEVAKQLSQLKIMLLNVEHNMLISL